MPTSPLLLLDYAGPPSGAPPRTLIGRCWRAIVWLITAIMLILFVAVRGPNGYRVIAHGDWPIARPAAQLRWAPPKGFADSLGNVTAGSYKPWWFANSDQLVAIAPVTSMLSIT